MKSCTKATLAALTIAFAGGVAQAEEMSRCDAYDADIDGGVARAALPPVTGCSSTPTTNAAEFTFTLTLQNKRTAKMVCNPERCTAPFLVSKKALPTT